MRTRNINSLLVEILFAMLFFALSATVILQVFVAARTESDHADYMSRMMYAAQNAADEAYLSDDAAEREIALDDGTRLLVSVSDEKTEAGTLRQSIVTALDKKGNVLLELPCSRYISGTEVAQ